MPRGKKATKRVHQKRYAVPIRAKKKAATKRTVKPKVQTRVSAKSVVVEKFETLDTELRSISGFIKQLFDFQKAAFIDNYRNFYLKTQADPKEFIELFEKSFEVIGVTEEELAASVEQYREEDTLSVTPAEDVIVQVSDNVEVKDDNLHIL